MTDVAATCVVWLNALANACGAVLLAPVAWLPGWASSTLIAAATSVLMLVAFKHTSHQSAIKRSRDRMKANLLALSLFNDNMPVALRAQGRVLACALRLLLLALVPMAVMLVPMCLILGQLALWYEARPLRVGEQAVVAVRWSDDTDAPAQAVQLQAPADVEVLTGPVRAGSRRETCWNVVSRRPGTHRLTFAVGGRTYDKELAVGDGYQRVSQKRPERSVVDALLHPWERPLNSSDFIRSIEIQYPERAGWTCGTGTWLVYWFLASMAFALVFRRSFNVNF
jgi:hypothetical protein